MIENIKVVFVNRHIGAIAIGYLVGRGVEALFASIMPSLNIFLTEILGRRFVEDPWVNARVSLVSNLVLTSFYFLVALAIGGWLYTNPPELNK